MTAPAPTRALTAAQMAQLVLLLQAQAAMRRRLTETAVAAATAPLAGFTGWWDAEETTRLIATILRTVQPTQLVAARSTDAFAARVLTTMTGRPAAPAGAVDVTKLRRAIPRQAALDLVAGRRQPTWVDLGSTETGPAPTLNAPAPMALDDLPAEYLDPAQAYGRVADNYRFNVVAKGDPPEKAAAKAHVRIAAVAQTDIALAIRQQFNRAFDLDRVTGWRRILRPDKGGGGPPCALCVVAADRVYRKEELQPLHSNCRCEVLPILDGMDPGIDLNAEDLQALYDTAGGTGALGLARVRVALAEHGELGPVLVDASRHYRGPADVARTQVPDPRVRARAQLESLLPSLARFEERAAAGEHVTDPLNWHRRRVSQLQRVLAA